MSLGEACTGRSRRRRRGGTALLEALVALAILATVGLGILMLVTDSGRVVAHVREREGEERRASTLLDAVALWPREDLDRHLGDRRQGPFRMQLQRVTQTLYTIVISDSTEQREILRTSLYRRLPREADDRSR